MFKRASRSYLADKEPELLVGLDLGTSKVTVVVAEREQGGEEAQIIGVGQAPSNGIRKGLIVNLDQAVRSVRQAVSDAQNMVGQDITEVTVAFGGGEVTSIRTKGMVSLGRSPPPCNAARHRTCYRSGAGGCFCSNKPDNSPHYPRRILT